MLSLVVVLSVGVLPLVQSGSGQQPGAASAVVNRQAGDDAVRRLIAEPPEVAQTYQALASKDKPDRMRAYGDLPGSMKAALWNHQLLTALAQHPEFNEEQRAVLYDAVALFTPEFFAITYPSPEWSNRVDQPLRKLDQRARAVFGVVLAARLFAHLGPDDPTAARQPASATASSPKTLHPNDLPHCQCSTVSDFCPAEYGPDFWCRGGGCIWGTNWGCGSLFAYPCNGLCATTITID